MISQEAYIQTPLGITHILGNAEGIQVIKTVEEPVEISNSIPAELQLCVTELNAYFKGELTQFSFKVNPKGTDFQKRVWQQLLSIPYGTTTTYAEITRLLGDMKAIRAVASANGKNPIWIVVPCHRVIGSDGSLTGYAGGLWRKKWLLEHENPVKQQSLF